MHSDKKGRSNLCTMTKKARIYYRQLSENVTNTKEEDYRQPSENVTNTKEEDRRQRSSKGIETNRHGQGKKKAHLNEEKYDNIWKMIH